MNNRRHLQPGLLKWSPLWLCIVLIAGQAIGWSATKPVSMLTGMKGTVNWKASAEAKAQPASLMMTLPAGAILLVGNQSTATLVYFANGHREQLLANSSAKLTADGCVVMTGKINKLAAASGKSGTVMQSARTETINGGLLTRSGPYRPRLMLLTPTEDSLLTVTPYFCWTAVPEAKQYQFVLTNALLRTLWGKTTTETALAYPEKMPALEAGKTYTWTVRALNGEKVISEKSLSFTVLAKSNYAEISDGLANVDATAADADDCSQLLWRASLCQTEKLYGDAIQYYQQIAARCPTNSEIHATLAWIYKNAKHADMSEYEIWKRDKLDNAAPGK